MKITKSRACLMAYVVSLVIVIMLSGIIDSEQISRITLATTIAGLFFAISDYFSFVANDTKESVNNIKKSLAYDDMYFNDLHEILSNNAKEAQRFLDCFGEECEVANYAFRILESCKETEPEIIGYEKECEERKELLEKEEKKVFKNEERSNWFLCVGFAFALVIVFLQIKVSNIGNFSNITTIISFGIITFTYLLKDVGEEHRKSELDMIKQTEYKYKSIQERLKNTRNTHMF